MRNHIIILLLGFSELLIAAPLFSQASQSQTFEDLATQAAAAHDAGKADEAIRLYTSALGVHPEWDEGWWYVGTLSYDADRYTESVSAFKKFVAINPKIGAAWAFLGLSEFSTHDYNAAFSSLQRANSLGYAESPEVAKVARYHLALLLNLNGEFEKAGNLLAPEFTPASAPDLAKVAMGLALLRVPVLPDQIDPSRDSLIHSAGEAAILLADGKNADASRILLALVEENRTAPNLHFALARMSMSVSNYPEAELQLREEIRVSDSSAAHEALAQALRQLRRPSEATAVRRDAVGLSAKNDAVVKYYSRTAFADARTSNAGAESPEDGRFKELASQARAAQASGDRELAILKYQRGLALRADWGEGWRNLGTIYYSAERYADAIPALKNSVTIDSSHSEAWALLGLSEFEIGDYKNSLIHLQRGNEIGFAGSPQAVQFAKYHLAVLLNQNGEFERATDLLIPYVGLGSLSGEIKFALGIALLRMPVLPDRMEASATPLVRAAGDTAALLADSKYDQAFPLFKKMLAEHPTTPYLHYAYGFALAAASQYDEAVLQLQAETRITPGSWLPLLRMASIALQLHHPEDALTAAERAVHLAPDSAEAHYLLGRAQLEKSDLAASIAEFEVARRLAPNSPEVHFNLARAYAKARRPADANEERATFERLNALVQRQKTSRGSQIYSVTQDQSGLKPSAEASSSPPQ